MRASHQALQAQLTYRLPPKPSRTPALSLCPPPSLVLCVAVRTLTAEGFSPLCLSPLLECEARPGPRLSLCRPRMFTEGETQGTAAGTQGPAGRRQALRCRGADGTGWFILPALPAEGPQRAWASPPVRGERPEVLPGKGSAGLGWCYNLLPRLLTTAHLLPARV